MFSVDPLLMDALMDRYREQVEGAEQAWLRRRAAARAPRWADALVVWASNLLISAGHRLQGWYRATGQSGDVPLPTATNAIGRMSLARRNECRGREAGDVYSL